MIFHYGYYHIPTGKRIENQEFNCEERWREFNYHFPVNERYVKHYKLFLFALAFWQTEDYVYYPMDTKEILLNK